MCVRRFLSDTCKIVKNLLLVTMLYIPVSTWAATLNIVDGQLMGATNDNVEEGLYNVSFVGGTCIDVFNGCDSSTVLAFNTPAQSTAASAALLDQVFIDGVDGNFNSIPSLTNGITGDWAYVRTINYIAGSRVEGSYA